jgi:hypothetical protein
MEDTDQESSSRRGCRSRWAGATTTHPRWMSQFLRSLKGLPNIVVDGKEGDEQGKGGGFRGH